MGVRLFDEISGRIVFFTIIIYFLNRKEINRLGSNVLVRFIFICLFYFLFCLVKNIQPYYPMMLGWLSALFTLAPYVNGCPYFLDDLYKLSRFSVIYSLIHVIVQMVLPFMIIPTDIPMQPKTFLYLLYYNREIGYMGLNRIQGYCWEPSNWNMILNVNLILSLYLKKPFRNVLEAIIAIITVMSTTGIVVMVATLFLNYLVFSNLPKFKRIFLFIISATLLGEFAYNELHEKLANASGEARQADMMVALAVAKVHPLLGADIDNLTKNEIAMNARIDSMERGEFNNLGLLEREGMVNSFAGLIVEWGIPLTILIIFSLCRCPLFKDKKLRIFFSIVFLMILTGTPIARCGFFFLFVFSSILANRFSNYKKNMYGSDVTI